MSTLGKADSVKAKGATTKYDWAQNQHKAQLAASQVLEASKVDPEVKYDEETVKARYQELKGVLIDSPEAKPENRETASVTAKGGVRITTKKKAS